MSKFQSIEDMEKAAQQEADRTASVKIGDYWLEVCYTLPDRAQAWQAKYAFTYKWGKNFVTRANAVNVLADGPR